MSITVVQYNPLNAASRDRVEEIARELRADVTVLVGTGYKAAVTDIPVEVSSDDTKYEYRWGWQKGRYGNKSCGISFLLTSSLHSQVRRVWVPPRDVAGRAAAVQIRQRDSDVTMRGVYLPPRTGTQAYRMAVDAVLKWGGQVLDEVPRRSTPMLCMDANDGFGMHQRLGGVVNAMPDEVVEPSEPEMEHYASAGIRRLFQIHDMAVLSAAWRTGPTYHGDRHVSKVDYICGPQGLRGRVSSCALRDHATLYMRVRISVAKELRESQRAPRLDLDKMMEALKNPSIGAEFLEQVERRFESMVQECHTYRDEVTTDEHWAVIERALLEEGVKFFQAAPRERHPLGAERVRHLRRRRELREELGAADDEEVERVQLELVMLTRRTRLQRRKEGEARAQDLLQQAREAWKRRKFHWLHAIRTQMVCNRRGLGMRIYAVPKPEQPERDVWRAFLRQPGALGGMEAEAVEPETLYMQLQEEAQGEVLLATQAVYEQALSDYRNMLQHMRHAHKRKATVAGTVPTELLLLGMGGVKVLEREPQVGDADPWMVRLVARMPAAARIAEASGVVRPSDDQVAQRGPEGVGAEAVLR